MALLLCASAAYSQKWALDDVKIYDSFEDLESTWDLNSTDSIHIINFWATWCSPCVKELPYFEELGTKLQGKPVKITLVSLDFPRRMKSKLIPFLNKNGIQSEVVVLDDPKQQRWIDQVSTEWSGAIPITVIRKNKVQSFYEEVFHSVEELEEIIQPLLVSK